MKRLLLACFLLVSFVGLAQEAYYNDVNLYVTGITLKNELSTKVTATHTNNLFYTPDIWNASMITDVNPNNANQVLLMYGWENGSDGDVRNDRERGINNNGGAVGEWNREHIYANSLGTPDLDQNGTEGPPYADAHNLRPCDTQTNSSRGNKLFASGSGNSGSSGAGWYPGDEWKGDVARIVMYMYIRYNDRTLPSNVGIGDSSSTPDEMIDLFLQWNAEDPVSDFERQRNAYHGNTSNTYAQGNRNPFIDNPRLATRIWGGPEAEDTWGIYTSSDTQAPSVPMNLVTSNITTSSIQLSWDASTDNTVVTSYDVYVDGSLLTSTVETNYTITDLASNTSFSFTVAARDAANNVSNQSNAIIGTTLEDTQAPTVPMNVIVSNETDVSFKLTWDASADDTGVIGYDILLDGNLNASSTENTYTVNGLVASTTYSVTVLAKDAAGNKSAQSNPINASTTDGSSVNSNELFFSEYIEGDFGTNKALEIANVTSNNIDLSAYNVRRQGGGTGNWSDPANLYGIVASGDVVVIINSASTIQKLIDEADIVVTSNFSTGAGEALTFNGDDPVALFKGETLIDIIGEFNSGGGHFAKDKTLRRKTTVSQPNTTFDELNEWDVFPANTVDDLGKFSSTLSSSSFTTSQTTVYPNPVVNYIFIETKNEVNRFEVYNILGSRVLNGNIIRKQIDVESLKKGIYILKIMNNSTLIKSMKFIK